MPFPPEAEARLALMRRHWWFRGRRAAVRALLARAAVPRGAPVLDFGCGPGHMGATLARYGPLTGVDASAGMLEVVDRAAYATLACASSPDAPGFPCGPFGLIACLDVLEHLEDDAALMRSLASLLAPAGRIVVSVPLRPDLFGPGDVVAGHVRRYTPESLRALLADAALEPVAESGYVVALLPVAARRRRAVAADEAPQGQEFELPPAPVNAALSALAVSEGSLARVLTLPPGLSAIVVARRAEPSPPKR